MLVQSYSAVSVATDFSLYPWINASCGAFEVRDACVSAAHDVLRNVESAGTRRGRPHGTPFRQVVAQQVQKWIQEVQQ